MRHLFESLGYQSGFFLSQLFSSTRTTTPSPLPPPLKQTQIRPPQQIFNWTHTPFHAAPPPAAHGFPANTKDETHLFLLPHSDEDMISDHDPDLKWPNGLSFFNALTGRSDDAKLLFGSDGLGTKQPLLMAGKKFAGEGKPEMSGSGAEDYLRLESHSGKARKVEGSKFKRSFTSPARMSLSSSSSTSMDRHHGHGSGAQGMDYRGSEAGIYSDIMDTFLE